MMAGPQQCSLSLTTKSEQTAARVVANEPGRPHHCAAPTWKQGKARRPDSCRRRCCSRGWIWQLGGVGYSTSRRTGFEGQWRTGRRVRQKTRLCDSLHRRPVRDGWWIECASDASLPLCLHIGTLFAQDTYEVRDPEQQQVVDAILPRCGSAIPRFKSPNLKSWNQESRQVPGAMARRGFPGFLSAGSSNSCSAIPSCDPRTGLSHLPGCSSQPEQGTMVQSRSCSVPQKGPGDSSVSQFLGRPQVALGNRLSAAGARSKPGSRPTHAVLSGDMGLHSHRDWQWESGVVITRDGKLGKFESAVIIC